MINENRNKIIDSLFLLGKRIIITGASSGIGRSCAIICASMGAELLLLGRDELRLKETLSMLYFEENTQHSFRVVDLQYPDSLKDIIKDFVVSRGTIGGFIHSAGIEMTTPLSFLKKEQFNEIFSINFFAGVELARLCSKKEYVDKNSVSFVFISSILSENAKSSTLFYSASKAAINAAMRTLAVELAPKKIRVNSVLPSVVETELMKSVFEALPQEVRLERLNKHLLGFGDPEDVAYACSYLLSDAAKWVTGTQLVVDGGYSCQ